MAILDLVLLVAALPLLVLSLVVLAEIIAGTFAKRPVNAQGAQSAPIAVVVPAHDEEAGIAATLRSIKSQLQPHERLIVVADNCSDATADIAAGLGAEVVIRTDALHRGKAFAVARGIEHLRSNPPAVVVIIDADCILGPDCLQKIGTQAVATGTPVQAHYQLVISADRRSPALAQKAFALKVKNTLRPTGLHNLGLPCQLMGTGMAFPWHLIADRDLSSGELAEDLVWGLQFAEAGNAPRFCPDATVTSFIPLSAEGQATQRARWETGHLTTISRHVPRVVSRALVSGNIRLLALALDAAVPPLALHALCVSALTVLALLLFLAGGSPSPLAVASMTVAALTAALAVAWAKAGRDIIGLSDLAATPAYVLSKLPLYVQILMGKEISWIRTKRDRT